MIVAMIMTLHQVLQACPLELHDHVADPSASLEAMSREDAKAAHFALQHSRAQGA